MRVLIVLTSAGTTANGKAKTGFSLPAFAEIYFALADAGADLALASPEGGAPPYDPADMAETPAMLRFRKDPEARNALNDTLRLDQIVADDFGAAIYPGGPGTALDLTADPHSRALLAALGRDGKPVGVIGEGAAALFAGPLVTAPDAGRAGDVAHRILALISRSIAP